MHIADLRWPGVEWDGYWLESLLQGRTAAADIAVRDWLETQARVATSWRDIPVGGHGDLDLIEALDAYEWFLMSALR